MNIALEPDMKEFSYLKEDIISHVKQVAEGKGERIYLVGGWLRDYLLEKKSNDYDFAVGGEAISLAREVASSLGGSFFILDPERDCARVVLKGKEQVCLDFSRLKGDNIAEDLRQRDITINALAVDLSGSETIIDPNGGLPDLSSGRIRLVSKENLIEDPLRGLRAFRLAAQLGFKIDQDSLRLISQYASLITRSSEERIRDELLFLLETKESYPHLLAMDETGLLGEIIPELMPLKGVEQPGYHHLDVFDHSTVSLAYLEEITEHCAFHFRAWHNRIAEYLKRPLSSGQSQVALLKLAALFHDLGKPQSLTRQGNGQISFTGHERSGAELAFLIGKKLKLSRDEAERLKKIVASHMRPGLLANENKISARAVHRFFRDLGEDGLGTLILSLADRYAARGPKACSSSVILRQYWVINHLLKRFFEEKEIITPPRMVGGRDLIEVFGLSPGPLIGQLLREIEEAYIEGQVKTREEGLALVERLIADRLKAED
ncbi:MAG: HD domain-containing protein [bacterium]